MFIYKYVEEVTKHTSKNKMYTEGNIKQLIAQSFGNHSFSVLVCNDFTQTIDIIGIDSDRLLKI